MKYLKRFSYLWGKRMEKIIIHNSDLHVSRLCFGGCPMGGHGWGAVSKKDLIDAVHEAIESDINFFDTADVYGLGESEKVLGEALGEKREKVIIASKFGVKVQNGKTTYDCSPEWIKYSLEGSLTRLHSSYIDLYQMHYYDGITPMEDIVEILEKLVKEGKIRYFGLSNISYKDIAKFMEYKSSFVSFQDEYSLASRKNEESFFMIKKKTGWTPMTWGSLGQGILTGKYNAGSVFGSDDRRSREIYKNFHGDKLLHNLKIVEVLKQIASETKKTIPAVAIRFILDYIPDSVVIAGVKNINQLRSNCDALNWTLSKEQIQKLESVSKWQE